jgi:hypothetical protein
MMNNLGPVNPYIGTVKILTPTVTGKSVDVGVSFRTNNLIMQPGSRLNFDVAGLTATINNFSASGNSSNRITIGSATNAGRFVTTSASISGNNYVTNNKVRIEGIQGGIYLLGSQSTKTSDATGWLLRDNLPVASDSDGMMIGFVT